MSDFAIVETSCEFRALAEARAWIESKSAQGDVQVPFLLMAVERSAPGVAKSWRSYSVCELRTFLDDMAHAQANGGEPPHLHELVLAGAPCKTYAEFDFKKFNELEKFGATDRAEMVVMLDAMLERFLEFMLGRLNDLLKTFESEVVLTRAENVVLLTAHKASKWSVHVIVDTPLSCESVVWASTRDCGNFITDTRIEFNEPLAAEALDESVYSDNHTLRIYRASKVDEPERILRDADAPADAGYVEETMLASLVSAIRVNRSRLDEDRVSNLHNQNDGDDTSAPLVILTSAFIELFKPFPVDGDESSWRPLTFNGVSRSERLSDMCVARKRTRSVPSSALVAQICAAPQLAPYEPRRWFSVVSSSFVTIACERKFCELRRAEHGLQREPGQRAGSASPVYLSLDMVNRQWRQLCWSAKCKAANADAVWRPMDEQLGALCDRYLLNEADSCRRARGAGRCLFGRPPEVQL